MSSVWLTSAVWMVSSAEIVPNPPTFGNVSLQLNAPMATTLLYEIHNISRLPTVGDFLSYARLVTPKQISDSKITGQGGAKIGNAHLKWAFSEAALMMLRYSERAQQFLARKQKKYGNGRAMTMLARKIARTVYYMWKRKEAFDAVKFFAS